MYNRYPIKEEWEEYYKFLEALRRTGVCNMYGAGVYLTKCFSNLTKLEATDILVNWIENYNELDKKYGWSETVFNKITD